MKKRRGYTFVELTAAIALIAIMAAGVFSALATFLKKRNENVILTCAVRETENIIECFKCDDFIPALKLYTGDEGISPEKGEGENYSFTFYYNSDGEYMGENAAAGGFCIAAEVEKVKSEEYGGYISELTVTASDEDKNVLIISEYDKGVTADGERE